jgi:hypothetical protein
MQIAVRAQRHDRTRQASRRDRELGTYALLRDVTSIPAVSSIDYTSESTLNEQRYTLQEKDSFSAVESRNQYHTRTRKRFPFDMTVDSRNESEIQNTHASLARPKRSVDQPARQRSTATARRRRWGLTHYYWIGDESCARAHPGREARLVHHATHLVVIGKRKSESDRTRPFACWIEEA